jgi:hypothetical protein
VKNIFTRHGNGVVKNFVCPTNRAVNGWGQNQPTPATLTEFLSNCYLGTTVNRCFYFKDRNEIEPEGHELHICKAVEQQEAPSGHPIAVMV